MRYRKVCAVTAVLLGGIMAMAACGKEQTVSQTGYTTADESQIAKEETQSAAGGGTAAEEVSADGSEAAAQAQAEETSADDGGTAAAQAQAEETSAGDGGTAAQAQAEETSAGDGPVSETVQPDGLVISGVDYTDYTLDDRELNSWIRENHFNMQNGACTRQGIVRAPYFKLWVNGMEIPVFVEKTTREPHCFAYIELSNLPEDGQFSLDIEMETHTERTNPVVLPERAGVTASIDGRLVRAVITAFGSYTFTFDRENGSGGDNLPLTLMVKPKEEPDFPEDYKIIELEPGEYQRKDTIFDRYKTVYYFKKGEYTIESIEIAADNVILYFEPGTLLHAKHFSFDEAGSPVYGTVFSSWGRGNVKILGHAALDMAMRDPSGIVLGFTRMKDIELAGFNIINSNSWTCCFTACRGVTVRDLVLIGYRTYSDGVMLSDCEDAVVSGCFVRTGDDALEVKSTSDGSCRTKNVLFENNAVWTDKGNAFGCIYESNYNQSDVTWRNNSVGFALADWTQYLGCCTISIEGSNPKIEDFDMHFENIEIYVSHCSLITIRMENGGSVHDIHFDNIRAKEASLNRAVAYSYIDLMISNADGGPLSDFTLDDLYFDGIAWNDTELTAENAEQEIRFSVPDGYPVDRSILHVNEKGG